MAIEQDTIDNARAADILPEAQRRGAKLRRTGTEWVGPCPACGGDDRFSINPRKNIFFCRVSGRGGDPIEMVMYLDGLPFDEAVAALTGTDVAPRRPRAKPAVEKDDNRYRQTERRRAYDIWCGGATIFGTAADKYLLHRGITIPPAVPLRFAGKCPYWHRPAGESKSRAIYEGPAMLAAMTDETGHFQGVHITWLDPNYPGEKARLECPESGDELTPKKMRGSKRRAAIRLSSPQGATRLVMGEGIETVLSIWSSEDRELRETTAYWAALDLGHMAGKAAKTIPHPTMTRTDKRGRVFKQKVPGPVSVSQPDRDLQIPDHFTDIVLLGDGDSDPFTTRMAIRRAAARYAAPGRTIRAAWAPDGTDFNDMLQGDACG